MPLLPAADLDSSYALAKLQKDESASLGSTCPTCTFINKPGSALCAMCEQFIGPRAHAIHNDGSWSCGSCEHHNASGMQECYYCDAPYVSAVASAAPLTIYCSRCGVRNSGTAGTCISCNHVLLSKFESLKHEWSDTTNQVARELGLHVKVKCPGCMKVCNVPSSACFRCGACGVCFAAPSVGSVTSFHVARLTRSLSSSVLTLFQKTDPVDDDMAKSKMTMSRALMSLFQQDGSSDEEDDNYLFGPPRHSTPPPSATSTGHPATDIPIGIRIPNASDDDYLSTQSSHRVVVVDGVQLPPPPSQNLPLDVMETFVAPPPMRKSKSAPTALSLSYERDWDLRYDTSRLSPVSSAQSSSRGSWVRPPLSDADNDADESKEELDDQDILASLRLSSNSQPDGGFNVPNADTIHI